jgi:hypothetical protein
MDNAKIHHIPEVRELIEGSGTLYALTLAIQDADEVLFQVSVFFSSLPILQTIIPLKRLLLKSRPIFAFIQSISTRRKVLPKCMSCHAQ